jgi:hypothetical protein
MKINAAASEYIPENFREVPDEPEDPIFGVIALLDADENLKRGTECSLPSSRNLRSPFESEPIDKLEVPEYHLPNSYFLKEPIFKSSLIQRFTLTTLFYMFYSMP